MARAYKIKKSANPSKESTGRSAGMTAPKKLMLLFTIVNRNKAEFYADVLQKFEINMQIILAANGTADTKIQSLLGLTDLQKSVLHGTDGADVAGSAAEHALGLGADGKHLIIAAIVLLHRHHGGLAEHYALPLDIHAGVCGTKVDSEVIGKDAEDEVENFCHRKSLADS